MLVGRVNEVEVLREDSKPKMNTNFLCNTQLEITVFYMSLHVNIR
jgi:hypothetical protein